MRCRSSTQPHTHAAVYCCRHVCVLAQADRSSSWYEHSNRNSAPSQPKSSSSPGSATKQRSKHYYESTPKRRKNTPYQQDSNQWQRQQQQPRQQQQVDDYDDDLEYDGPGWWEGQRGVRQEGQDNAGLNLLPWQEERLLIAAAGSKKKMQVGACLTAVCYTAVSSDRGILDCTCSCYTFADVA